MAIISARKARYISLSVSDKPPEFDTFDAGADSAERFGMHQRFGIKLASTAFMKFNLCVF
jgi:hypothetical protein